MRVIYFTRDYTPHDQRFLFALAETDHEVYFLRLERRGAQLEDRPLPRGITQIRWIGGQKAVERRDYPRMSRALREVIGEYQPDVIHAGSIHTAALVAAMTRFPRLVSMSWGYDMLMDAESNRKLRQDTQLVLDRSKVLVCDCRAVEDKAVNGFGFPREQVVRFPWGVDLAHFHPRCRAQDRAHLGWDEDDFVILSLRSWEPIYGVDTVARGFIKAARQEPNLWLLLLGGGSQAPLLRKILEDARVMDRVYFGHRASFDELPAFYRAADLYVSASHTDGSSVSLMEALASGCPALVSSIPGNLEWIEPEKHGWFFAVDDADELAQRMLEAYRRRHELGAVRENARKLAEERADWNKNFQKLMTAYDMARE